MAIDGVLLELVVCYDDQYLLRQRSEQIGEPRED